MELLRNLRNELKGTQSKSYSFRPLNARLTLRTLPSERRSQLESILSPSPLSPEYRDSGLKVILKNRLLLAYGVVEFEGDEEFAQSLLDREGAGEDNADLIREIMLLNPSAEEKMKNFIIIMAFNHDEVALLSSCMTFEAKKEICQYLSGKENVVEAINECKELLNAFGAAANIAQQHGMPIERACLIIAKSAIAERGLIPKEELEKWPDMPQVDVNVK